MWHEYLKKKYSAKTLQAFLKYVSSDESRQKSVQLIKNNATGLQDWYYPTEVVMFFEFSYRPVNSERAFPQE